MTALEERLERDSACPACNGSGRRSGGNCRACMATGRANPDPQMQFNAGYHDAAQRLPRAHGDGWWYRAGRSVGERDAVARRYNGRSTEAWRELLQC